MALRINTNVSSINAQRNLAKTSNRLNKSLERLSSGLRINRAGDDAAGLAISENLKSDIRVLEQSQRNAQEGISMVQTAEGALDGVSSILIRMRELSQQASNETLGASERTYLDNEFQALNDEIERIADNTSFNGIQLLDGSEGSALDLQVGVNAGDTISVDFSTDMQTAALGLDSEDLTGADNTNAMAASVALEAAIDSVSSTRADFGASQNRLESSIMSIGNSIENLSAANSRIRDVDIASETSAMTANQILQQAGVSVLSQANSAPQMALMLLQ